MSLYFGTKERMAWVKAPAINAGLSRQGWGAEGQFLNGGAYVRTSDTSHMRYEFAWNLAAQEDVYAVLDYANKVYGNGLIYFLEPFSRETNCLPLFWAVPRLQQSDAPPLTKEARPTLVNTTANNYAYPTKSAVFTLTASTVSDELWVPIPPGYVFHFGAHGSATSTAGLVLKRDDGTDVPVTLLATSTSTLTNASVSGTTGVTITATGEGQLTLAGMIAQVLPVGAAAPTGSFKSGRGHSGCRFAPNSTRVTGYSAPSALDKVGASAVLVETGAWEDAE